MPRSIGFLRSTDKKGDSTLVPFWGICHLIKMKDSFKNVVPLRHGKGKSEQEEGR